VVRSLFREVGFHDLAWRVLDSRYFGVPQRRRRIFILARRARGRRAAEVLLEPEGGGGDFEAGRKAGSRVAASLSRGSASAGVSALGRRQEDDENIVNALTAPRSGAGGSYRLDEREVYGGGIQVVSVLDRKGGGADDNDAQAGHLVTHALTAEGFDASEDGTGCGTPIVADGVRATPGLPGRMDVDPVIVDPLVSRSSRGRATPLAPGHNTDSHIALGGGAPASSCAFDPQPDGPRYAACGDAVTVNVAEWIGRRVLHYQEGRLAA
jgi:site-specific DNA-cytosine methylase